MATATKARAKKRAIQVTGFARTILYVKDWAKDLKFYRETLGLKPAYPVAEGWAEFDVGGKAFCIHSGRTSAARTKGVCSVSFAVKDLDGSIESLTAAGVRMGEVFSPCAGLRCSQFSDLSGNELCLEGP